MAQKQKIKDSCEAILFARKERKIKKKRPDIPNGSVSTVNIFPFFILKPQRIQGKGGVDTSLPAGTPTLLPQYTKKTNTNNLHYPGFQQLPRECMPVMSKLLCMNAQPAGDFRGGVTFFSVPR